MPIYTYKCKSCEAITESYSTIDDRDKERNCEECKGILERQMDLDLNVVDQSTDYHRRKKVLEKEITRIKNEANLAKELDMAAARDFV